MFRLDRSDLLNIPRPVYELFIDLDDSDALMGVMVGDQSRLPCKMELFEVGTQPAFQEVIERWIVCRGEPVWQRVARECARRFSHHIIADMRDSV